MPPAHAVDPVAYDRAGRAWFGAVLIVGVGLRAWQWLANAPLWFDELALTNGVLAGSFTGLFDGPSDFGQVAPPGFLAIEWLMLRLQPGSELAARAPSFVLGCAGIGLTWVAARELVGERDGWVAAALVALPGPLIFMSGQVKPYAADVFFAALLLACALRHDRTGTRRSLWMLVGAGVVVSLFSLGGIFVLAGVCSLLLARTPWRGTEFRRLVPLIAAWTASVAVSLLLARRLLSPAANVMMHDYWKDAFPVLPPRTLSDLTWPARNFLDLLWNLMGLRGVRVFAVAIVAATVVLWRRRPSAVALFWVPIAAVFIAAALRQYPFGTRVLLWTAPILALLLAVLSSAMADWLRRSWRRISLLPAAATLATPAMSVFAAPPPYERDNIRPVIALLHAEARPGDPMYVFWSAWHSWQWYGRSVTATLGGVHQGGCPLDYPRGFLRDIDRFRGATRVWVLFARVQDADAQATVLRYLDTVGVRTGFLPVESRGVDHSARVDLYRYDLSDSSRLGLASAATFQIPASQARRELGCPRLDAMMRRADGTRVVPLLD